MSAHGKGERIRMRAIRVNEYNMHHAIASGDANNAGKAAMWFVRWVNRSLRHNDEKLPVKGFLDPGLV